MAPPPSSLLRDLLAADGFKNRRSKRSDSSAPASSRAVSMRPQNRRPGKPARSQSDVLTRSRVRNGGVGSGDDSKDAGDERRAATTTRRSSTSVSSARSYSNKGNSDGGVGARKGSAASAAIPAMDESALNAIISLAAGSVKQFANDEGFRASLRTSCASLLGESDHRAVLDLRVLAQTVERAAREEDFDPRDLKRASVKLHDMVSLDAKDEDAVTASGVPYPRLAACSHLYMSVVSKLQKRHHSAAVHVLEAFCLAPQEARTALLPALWDRLFRPGLSHLRTWRERESAATSSDERVKEVEKMFTDVLDDGTRVLACYYRDWLLGRTDAMAIPDVPAPPTTVHASGIGLRCSTSTSYDISSDVVFTSGSLSPAKFMNGSTVRRSDEIEEEEEVHVESAHEEKVRFKMHVNGVFHELDDGDARSCTPKLQIEENILVPKKLVEETSELQVQDKPIKESSASTSYPLISDISAMELLTSEFCKGPLQCDSDGNQLTVFATVPSDFLCPLTRQIFNRPVTIETGQTFERHAVVQWFDIGFKVCPVTGQELESLSIPDTNRVLKRLIENWKSEHCKNLISESSRIEEKLSVTVIEKFVNSGSDMSQKLERARQLMAIGGVDFLLRKFQEGEEDEKAQAAELLLFCIRAEGSCRNYVAIKIRSSSVLQLLQSEVLSARRTAVCLLTELLCLRRMELFEFLLRGLGTKSIVEAMDVLLEHLRSLPVREQAPVAVLLLRFDALVEHHSNIACGYEAVKAITHSLRCSLHDDDVALNTRKALLLLGGHFSFSGDLAEDWMLKQAGFIDGSRATPTDSDATVPVQPAHAQNVLLTGTSTNSSESRFCCDRQGTETAEHEAWLRHVTATLLGGNGRRSFLEALSKCLDSPATDLVSACLTTAGWLTRSLASVGDAADMQLAAFSALVPRLKQCLAAARPNRHRVLAAVSLHNFGRIPDCRALLMLLADRLRDDLADLVELTWTARQLSAELHE